MFIFELPPTTAAGRRSLPLTDVALVALKSHRDAQAKRNAGAGGRDTIIVTEAGTLVHPDILGKWWRRDRSGLGAERQGLHELRRSYLTALARAGMHPNVMQALAGHANCAITIDIYTHTDTTAKRNVNKALKRSMEDEG